MKTMSHPSWTWVSRAASLSLRFTLFLTTALPTLRPTEKPNRLVSRSLGRAISKSSLSDQPLPSRRTAAKSFDLLRRWSLRIDRPVRNQKRDVRPSVLPVL